MVWIETNYGKKVIDGLWLKNSYYIKYIAIHYELGGCLPFSYTII